MHTLLFSHTYLSNTLAWFIKVHVLSIFAVHAQGLFGRLAFCVLLEFELSHTVKQFGQVTGNLRVMKISNKNHILKTELL